MIEKLVARNFQVHGKLVLKLDPHVTTIVGPTDAGKSAITRTLRWLALNKPGGTDFRKDGTDKTSVTLYVDGHKVTRVRGKKRNSYHLDGKKFSAFGKEVPEAISSLLCLDDLNFQRQIDPPFWFTESAPEVSRRLNQVVDLSLIDSTLKKLSSQDREARSELKVSHERLARAETELASLRKVKGADRDLRKLERMDRTLEELEEQVRTLSHLLEGAEADQKTVDRLSGDLKAAEEDAERLVKVAGLIEEVESDFKSLGRLVVETHEIERVVRDLEKQLRRTERKFQDEVGEYCPLCERGK